MISVVIPSYKNKEKLLENLNHNLKFLKDCQIIIVNDDPEESLKNFLPRSKNILLIENKKNLGFGQSVNRGVKQADGNYIMLLNSDVQLINGNYQLAINNFHKDPSLFAVSLAQKEKDGSIVGKNKVYWHAGLYLHQKATDLNFGNNGWAEGGASLIDKNKFLKLNGFDPVYSPFYWEDIDLSSRARKAGYRIIFEPKILVIHHHESTIGRYFTKKQIKIIAYRNQLIFTWKNLTSPILIIKHLLYLPYLLITHLIIGDYLFLIALIKAVSKLSQIKK